MIGSYSVRSHFALPLFPPFLRFARTLCVSLFTTTSSHYNLEDKSLHLALSQPQNNMIQAHSPHAKSRIRMRCGYGGSRH